MRKLSAALLAGLLAGFLAFPAAAGVCVKKRLSTCNEGSGTGGIPGLSITTGNGQTFEYLATLESLPIEGQISSIVYIADDLGGCLGGTAPDCSGGIAPFPGWAVGSDANAGTGPTDAILSLNALSTALDNGCGILAIVAPGSNFGGTDDDLAEFGPSVGNYGMAAINGNCDGSETYQVASVIKTYDGLRWSVDATTETTPMDAGNSVFAVGGGTGYHIVEDVDARTDDSIDIWRPDGGGDQIIVNSSGFTSNASGTTQVVSGHGTSTTIVLNPGDLIDHDTTTSSAGAIGWQGNVQAAIVIGHGVIERGVGPNNASGHRIMGIQLNPQYGPIVIGPTVIVGCDDMGAGTDYVAGMMLEQGASALDCTDGLDPVTNSGNTACIVAPILAKVDFQYSGCTNAENISGVHFWGDNMLNAYAGIQWIPEFYQVTINGFPIGFRVDLDDDPTTYNCSEGKNGSGGDAIATSGGFADNGAGKLQVTMNASHDFEDGDLITIAGSTDYDGQFAISNSTSTTFDMETVDFVDNNEPHTAVAAYGVGCSMTGTFKMRGVLMDEMSSVVIDLANLDAFTADVTNTAGTFTGAVTFDWQDVLLDEDDVTNNDFVADGTASDTVNGTGDFADDLDAIADVTRTWTNVQGIDDTSTFDYGSVCTEGTDCWETFDQTYTIEFTKTIEGIDWGSCIPLWTDPNHAAYEVCSLVLGGVNSNIGAR